MKGNETATQWIWYSVMAHIESPSKFLSNQHWHPHSQVQTNGPIYKSVSLNYSNQIWNQPYQMVNTLCHSWLWCRFEQSDKNSFEDREEMIWILRRTERHTCYLTSYSGYDARAKWLPCEIGQCEEKEWRLENCSESSETGGWWFESKFDCWRKHWWKKY